MKEPKQLEKLTISHLKALFCGNFWSKVLTYILKIDKAFLQKFDLTSQEKATFEQRWVEMAQSDYISEIVITICNKINFDFSCPCM